MSVSEAFKMVRRMLEVAKSTPRAVAKFLPAPRPRPEPGKVEILPPYGGQPIVGWRRVAVWLSGPLLVLFCLIYGIAYALVAPFLFVQFAVPILVLAALVVWALPDMRDPPARPLRTLFFAYFGVLFLWPSYLAIALPGLPWISLVRLTGFPMVFLLLIGISVSAEFRRALGKVLKVWPLVWQLLLVVVVLQILSIAFSENVTSSVQKLVVAQVNWTAIFFVSCFVFLTPGHAERWAAALWGIVVIVSTIGIWENSIQAVPWAGHIPEFLQIEDEAVMRILAGAVREGQYRIQSVFTTSLGLSEFVALSLPFVLHFAMGAYKVPVRIAAAATVPLLLYIVWGTDSRLGLFGFILSFLMYYLLWGLLLWRKNKQSIVGPTTVLAYPAVVVIAFATTIFIGRIREKVWGSGQYAASNEGRLSQYETGLPMIFTRPFGHGIGGGAEALGATNPAGMLTIDSYYLVVGLEYGIIGFVAYYGMFILTVFLAGRVATETPDGEREYSLLVPLTIALANFVVIKAVFSNDENHPIAFMMLGMVLALVWRVRNHPEVTSHGVVLT